jgi:hypothetical protein
VAGSCEHGNEPLGSIKGGEFLDCLTGYKLLKMDSAAWNKKHLGTLCCYSHYAFIDACGPICFTSVFSFMTVSNSSGHPEGLLG